jgi:hypothetical protein
MSIRNAVGINCVSKFKKKRSEMLKQIKDTQKTCLVLPQFRKTPIPSNVERIKETDDDKSNSRKTLLDAGKN